MKETATPRVTVVTAVLNNCQFIRTTIESVLAQTYPNLEYLVKDGGSTDGTLELLGEYGPRIRVISEKDEGVYHALNRGIELASGEIIGLIHSDDFYADKDVVARMVAAMTEAKADIAWGDLVYVDRPNTHIVRRWRSSGYAPGKFLTGWHPPHPTVFITRRAYRQHGAFRTEFRIAADYELMLRLLEKHHLVSCYLPETVAIMRWGGASSRLDSMLWHARLETLRAWKVNGLRGGMVASILKQMSKLRQLNSRFVFTRRR